ncbi:MULTISPECIES: hypothetical protein [Maritimibacter]|jgi:hypothetical protein|uniref:Uncharacterized protein n=1 Tax=Maritimibacter alkaliphilus HTCC2654 TaxID=314271 RepID=A3VHP4_9RHOB|nr:MULTISPECIES: hypothetical protein [Maritimibacter]EAQ12235.1 hypothetical protein RB2654_08517 [Rhodobacterales bacterium HTCC2654] [Maritimibacter alkaliphilus HTCC2654]TYP85476.1 hypothetical protein BD830_101438 [Maritimibacter alkaliphilus HTCC2654]
MTTITLVGVGAFFSGVALMYLVMSRTANKRRLEEMQGSEA